MHKILENILTESDIKYLKQVFDDENHYHTKGMEKASLPLHKIEFHDFVTDLLENKISFNNYEIVGDNFYRHSNSYFPHCDAIELNAWMNIVIPIELTEIYGQQKFIVFDQCWSGQNATWMGKFKLPGDFSSNKKREDRPCDSEHFCNGTKQELPENLWENLDQTYFDKDYFHGMSGTAYDWVPGHIIVFDSYHIHATGKMQCKSKLGLSIRTAHK